MGINEFIQIGSKIKEYRKEKGFTQKKMAELVGIPYSTYSNYENNNREPKGNQLQKIADILDVDIIDLIWVTEMVDNTEQTLSNFGKEIYDAVAHQDATKENTLIHQYRKLNDSGKDEAIKRVEELTEIKKYTEYQKDTSTIAQTFLCKESNIQVNAAHERTDITLTEEMRKHDDDIMDDENF